MITASIVTYNTSKKDLDNLRNSFKSVQIDFILYIIDNSPTDNLKRYFESFERVRYIHNPSNPGFGAAHNIAFSEAIKIGADYHFVINPDVYFNEDVFSPMIEYMERHREIGMIMPQILNLDGSVQNLPKLLPSPLDVFMRKVKKPKAYYKKFIERYELRFVNQKRIYEAPILSGCFTLFKISAIQEVGAYDDRYFMYFEDWDLSRRINQKFKTIYFPEVSVYHGYESGANKSKRLFKIFVQSAVSYFNKWGWFFDRNRIDVNERTLLQFEREG